MWILELYQLACYEASPCNFMKFLNIDIPITQ
uniref:Uncharacterized protein n=1 Tax=Arundo donax TaxID=35708 RepID=A0A0A9F5S4_ARUDO